MDETSKAIGELLAETRSIGERLEKIENALHMKADRLDTRVRKLELWRSGLAGASAVLGTALAWVFSHPKG